ncbi:MAG: sterol desaturase family protein [Oceanospirillaceae bacterium]|nr:sterol desaturase family protein [Oceanospirillaceae bacterium]
MDSFFQQYWSDLTSLFSNSQQRLYWGYLVCAIIIAALYSLKKQPKQLKASISNALGLPHWLSRSARADYQLIIINKAIYLLCNPILIGKLSIATLIFELMHQWLGQRPVESDIPSWIIISAFTAFIFIFDDFARFYTHKLMHQIPWLWEFHKTHHSATTLTPLTVLRTHPVEGLLFAIRSAFVQGISIGVFVFLFADKVDLYTVLKVNVLVFIFNVAGANLRHSHISIRYYRAIENIFISPAQHHIHHSTAPRHFNKNYGAILAIWDKCFNCHCYSEDKPLSFGLSKNQNGNEQSLQKLYLAAFVNSYKIIKAQLGGCPRKD